MIYVCLDAENNVVELSYFEEDQEDLSSYIESQKTLLQLSDIRVIKLDGDYSPCGIGDVYDGKEFKPKKPFPSWLWDEEKRIWRPPVFHPKVWPEFAGFYYEDDYKWDEQNQSWIKL